jgi:hypothetical protein
MVIPSVTHDVPAVLLYLVWVTGPVVLVGVWRRRKSR